MTSWLERIIFHFWEVGITYQLRSHYLTFCFNGTRFHFIPCEWQLSEGFLLVIYPWWFSDPAASYNLPVSYTSPGLSVRCFFASSWYYTFSMLWCEWRHNWLPLVSVLASICDSTRNILLVGACSCIRHLCPSHRRFVCGGNPRIHMYSSDSVHDSAPYISTGTMRVLQVFGLMWRRTNLDLSSLPDALISWE